MFSHGLTHRLLNLALSGDAELFEQLSDARIEDVLLHRAPLRSHGYLSLACRLNKGQASVGEPLKLVQIIGVAADRIATRAARSARAAASVRGPFLPTGRERPPTPTRMAVSGPAGRDAPFRRAGPEGPPKKATDRWEPRPGVEETDRIFCCWSRTASAVVVAETYSTLEFRDRETMQLQSAMQIPKCSGINHADFSIDGRYAIFTCEFSGGGLVKIDMFDRKVVGRLQFDKTAMPQDIRIAPDGSLFYVADMMADGVHLIDGDAFTEVGFIPTGIGAHGLYPSRDGTKLYVSNRGSHSTAGAPHGMGSVSVIDFATRKVEANWPVPGGGSPDMGNVSADGRTLWLSGRFDDVVYVIDTTTGDMKTIPVGKEPHGLTIWPQPGRYSLGHTGNMR